ncbi:ATP-binding cassette domain-containing protein [Rosenbergiella nectarea]|uniref:ATP-binding cassette domain-containing protein n=1 Tax=Rosenbergiella nectarea TaxID=988801 RepID=UPI001F4EFB11|nr:ATP-binding cassette domain-containing protein [Rosenbergiella nectarea]
MSQLQIIKGQLTFTHGDAQRPIFDKMTMSINKGESVVLLGPSGCGKSTLLNVFAGFQPLDKGQVTLNNQCLSGPSGQRAVVFQDDALLPWLTTEHNVEIGLKIQGVPKAQRQKITNDYLELVGLAAHAKQPIQRLSGGQRQRLGLARALAINPDFLLLDEPFGALDALTREKMQALLLTIWKETGVGFLLITHSVDEALLLATDLYLLQGPPTQIMTHQQPPFARRFLDGETVRSLKSDSRFTHDRQSLLDQLLEVA